MIKVIDIVSTETGEILGYFKKEENIKTWTWVMYSRKCEPVVLDKSLPTYKICDATRNVRTKNLGFIMLYRLLPNYAHI